MKGVVRIALVYTVVFPLKRKRITRMRPTYPLCSEKYMMDHNNVYSLCRHSFTNGNDRRGFEHFVG